MMKLETKRLILVPCTERSLYTVEYEIGPHIQMHIEKLKCDASFLGWGPWFVLDKKNHKALGDVGFKGKPNQEKTVEVGYGILPPYQNKGIATEAVKEVVRWAFSSGKVDRVVAECLVDNSSSVKVLQRLGMKKIGIDGNMIYWGLENHY
jgi:[ribosomal protein S5]-alanine N-acetyltransferase